MPLGKLMALFRHLPLIVIGFVACCYLIVEELTNQTFNPGSAFMWGCFLGYYLMRLATTGAKLDKAMREKRRGD